MSPYQTSIPRKSFVIGALALTALTVALAVVGPAQVQSGDRNARAVADSSKSIAPAAVEAVPERLQVEVIGVREPALLSVDARTARAKRKQDS